MNLYAYVGGNPLNILDPLGEAGCADLAAQNLSGECFDSSNFRSEDKFNKRGEVSKPNNKFDRDAVGTQAVDTEAGAYANSQNQETGNEQVSRIDSTTSEDSSEVATASAIKLKSSTSSSATYDPSEIANAEGTVHTHPTAANEITPGRSDWQAASLGVANYVAHGTRSVVVEISGGQIRVRVVAGTLTDRERSQIRSRVNTLQTFGRRY